jgi:LacI family transcriptional regulator
VEIKELNSDAASALGFDELPVSRVAPQGAGDAIGVLTQQPASTHYGALQSGIEIGLRGTGYRAISAVGVWEPEWEREAISLLLEHGVRGLIILGGRLPDDELDELVGQTPMILVGRSFKGREDRRRQIHIDNQEGARTAVRHLLDLGHRRIAHIAGEWSQEDAHTRLQGYWEALADAGVKPDSKLVVRGTFETESGYAAMLELLERTDDFTAVFSAGDQMAFGAHLALFQQGIRVPGEISLIGFDDHPESAFHTPPLTTIRQPNVEIGMAAGTGMVRLLNGLTPHLPLFRPELIVRESTAPIKTPLATRDADGDTEPSEVSAPGELTR